MGKQLKTTDILGELAKDEKPSPQSTPESSAPPKTTKREMDISALKLEAERAATGKPSPYQSDLRAKLRDKTQFSFGLMPKFVVEQFDALSKSEGMNKREYLYHLLRKAGADIPPYDEMDGRKL